MSVLLAISPLLVVAIGALLLMLTEAFGKPTAPEGFGPGGLVVDAGAGRASELGLGSAVVLFAGAIASLAVWLVGPENFEKLDVLLPYLVVDRFTVFFSFVLCLATVGWWYRTNRKVDQLTYERPAVESLRVSGYGGKVVVRRAVQDPSQSWLGPAQLAWNTTASAQAMPTAS